MDESTKSGFDDLKSQAAAQETLPEWPPEGLDEQEPTADSPETSQAPDESEQDDGTAPAETEVTANELKKVLDQLKETQRSRDQQAGRAGHLEQRLKELEQRLQDNQQPQQQEQQAYQPLKAKPEDVDAFMSQYRDDWSEMRDDDYMRETAQMSYDMALNVAHGMHQELQKVQTELEGLRFERKLESSGLDSQTFEQIVQEFPSLQNLSQQEQFEIVKRMGKSFGSGGQPAPAQGARATQPRIETPMGGGSTQNPQARSLQSLQQARQQGDMDAEKKAMKPIWQQWLKGQGLT